jgi:hypothetical protein
MPNLTRYYGLKVLGFKTGINDGINTGIEDQHSSSSLSSPCMDPTYGHLLETLNPTTSHGHYLLLFWVVACQAAKPY